MNEQPTDKEPPTGEHAPVPPRPVAESEKLEPKGDSPRDLTKLLALILSGLSLIVSLSALYYSQLAPPALDFYLGRQFEIYYPRDGGFGMYIPVTAVNTTNSSGTLRQLAVVLSRPGEDSKYFFNWASYGVRDPETGDWTSEAIAHPIVVPAKSSVSKIFWFIWRPSTRPEIVLGEGTYDINVLALTDSNEELRWVTGQRFALPQQIVDVVNRRRIEHDPRTIIMSYLWVFHENEVLSTKDLRRKIKGFEMAPNTAARADG